MRPSPLPPPDPSRHAQTTNHTSRAGRATAFLKSRLTHHRICASASFSRLTFHSSSRLWSSAFTFIFHLCFCLPRLVASFDRRTAVLSVSPVSATRPTQGVTGFYQFRYTSLRPSIGDNSTKVIRHPIHSHRVLQHKGSGLVLPTPFTLSRLSCWQFRPAPSSQGKETRHKGIQQQFPVNIAVRQ